MKFWDRRLSGHWPRKQASSRSTKSRRELGGSGRARLGFGGFRAISWSSSFQKKWSGLPVVHVRPTVLLEGFFLILTPESVRETNQIRLPFGEGKTSPGGVEDVASRDRCVARESGAPHRQDLSPDWSAVGEHGFLRTGVFEGARPHDYLSGRSGRAVEGLLQRGLPAHLVNHLATMADLHRAGRYDRMSDDVFALTGQKPLSMQEFVTKNVLGLVSRSTHDTVSPCHGRGRGSSPVDPAIILKDLANDGAKLNPQSGILEDDKRHANVPSPANSALLDILLCISDENPAMLSSLSSSDENSVPPMQHRARSGTSNEP